MRLIFCWCDLDINPMTLKPEGDLDVLKMYPHTRNEAAGLRHSKLLTVTNEKKYEYSSRSRSNVTKFQTLLAFTMGHIPTKLHQFLISSFQDSVQTDRHTEV